jgi:hypothetical protein
MSWVAAAVAGGTLVGGYLSSKGQKDAANTAATAQTEASQLGIEEQQRQFDAIQKLLQPYVTAGNGALTGQQDLLGTNGAAAQSSAIAGIQSSPQFTALQQQGNDAILANASATGGLRGGNVQGALAQFSPALLSQLIDQQYSRLGGLTSLGQNAAAGVGNAGLQTGNNVTQLLGQQGSATAGAALAAGKANSQFVNSATSALTNFIGAKF